MSISLIHHLCIIVFILITFYNKVIFYQKLIDISLFLIKIYSFYWSNSSSSSSFNSNIMKIKVKILDVFIIVYIYLVYGNTPVKNFILPFFIMYISLYNQHRSKISHSIILKMIRKIYFKYNFNVHFQNNIKKVILNTREDLKNSVQIGKIKKRLKEILSSLKLSSVNSKEYKEIQVYDYKDLFLIASLYPFNKFILYLSSNNKEDVSFNKRFTYILKEKLRLKYSNILSFINSNKYNTYNDKSNDPLIINLGIYHFEYRNKIKSYSISSRNGNKGKF